MNQTSKLAGNLHLYDFEQADSVWSIWGLCPCIITDGHRIGHSINILEEWGDGEIPEYLEKQD